MRQRSRSLSAIGIGGIALLLAGCHGNIKPTNENFSKGLNAYYSTHKDCLFQFALRFPYEVSPGAEQKKTLQQMQALEDAGLVTPQEDKTIKVTVYNLTPIGERAGGRFCYGHREVTNIDSFTPPQKNENGLLESQVSFHYKLADVAVWAKTDKMKAAFPEAAKAIEGEGTGTVKLANAGAGWQIPQ